MFVSLLSHLTYLVVKIVSKPLSSSFMLYEAGHYGVAAFRLSVLQVFFSHVYIVSHSTVRIFLVGAREKDANRVPFGACPAPG